MRTYRGGRPAPRRPRHDTIGLFPLEEAAQRFATLSDYPEQAPALAALLHAAGAHLRTATLDGVPLTSPRWIADMLDAARHGEPPSPEEGAPPPQPGDDEDDTALDPDPDPGLDDFDTSDEDEGQGAGPAPDTRALVAAWDDLDLLDEDDEDEEGPVGGEHGEFSYVLGTVPRGLRSDLSPGVRDISAYIAWHEQAGHPGLAWLLEGLLLRHETAEKLALEAGCSPSTIARYRAKAPQLYAAAHPLGADAAAPARGAETDGRRARGDARRQRIVAAITTLREQSGRPPSVRAVQRFLGLSSMNALYPHLTKLREDVLVRTAAGGRGLEVVEQAESVPHSCESREA